MIVSTLLINVGDNPDRPRPGRSWLRNVYRVHHRLCMAFPSDERKISDENFLKPYKPEDFGQNHIHVPRGKDAGFLFRIDPIPGGQTVIVVQSAIQPDWDYAFQNADYLLAAPPQTRQFHPQYPTGKPLLFRLMANPTRKIDTKSGPDGNRRNGKRVPVQPENLLRWLVQKGEQSGFSVVEKGLIIQTSYIHFNKPNTHQKERVCDRSPSKMDYGVRLRAIRYDGVLGVTDSDRFHAAIAQGIGSGKSFGFGLLSVAPMKATKCCHL